MEIGNSLKYEKTHKKELTSLAGFKIIDILSHAAREILLLPDPALCVYTNN